MKTFNAKTSAFTDYGVAGEARLRLRTLQATPEQQAAIAGMLVGIGMPVPGIGAGEKVVGVYFVVGPGASDQSPVVSGQREEDRGAARGDARPTEGQRSEVSGQGSEMVKELVVEVKAMRKELRENRGCPAEPVSEEVAHRVFGLVKRLDGGPKTRKAPLERVFRMLVLEGRSQEHVALKCNCVPSLVTLRVDEIEKRMGRSIGELKALASQLGEMDPVEQDPHARRLYRRGLADETGEDDQN